MRDRLKTDMKSLLKGHITIPFVYRDAPRPIYTIGVHKTSHPLQNAMDEIQVISHQSISHPVPLQMMADPFIIKDNSKFYIFYEELTRKIYVKGADIAVLQSIDGHKWERLGVAIREPFHLSFPNVFCWKNEYYMIPEAYAGGDMRIYKALNFPMKWKLYTKVFEGKAYSDPMIYVKDEIIYCWYHTHTDGDALRLIYADDILGPWKEHPVSPIRVNGNETRPAGTINEIDGKLYYFIQDHSEGYGTGVIAYEILKLNKKRFVDKRLDENPLLWKNGNSWAKEGMHHYSMCKLNDKEYLCATDGKEINHDAGWRFDLRDLPIIY